MVINLALLTIAASILGQPPVDEAFAILQRRAVSEAELAEAVQTIDQAFPDGDEDCVRRLVDIWLNTKWGQTGTAKELAFKKADDKTLFIILDAVRTVRRQWEEQGKPEPRPYALGVLGVELSKRLKDPEPLMRFAFEIGEPFHWYHCTPALKDEYLLLDIRRRTEETEYGGGSVARFLSDDGMGPLRRLLREMYNKNPRSDGVWMAIDTLAELSDDQIIPDLEAILAGTLPAWRVDRVRRHLAKLKYQDDPGELMRIVETERESRRLLSWAVYRLLSLGTNKVSVRRALRQNRGPSSKGVDIAESITYAVFDEGPSFFIHPEHGRVERLTGPGVRECSINTLLFDHDEYRQYLRDHEAAGLAFQQARAEMDALYAAPGVDAESWDDVKARANQFRQASNAQFEGLIKSKYTLQAIVDAAPEVDEPAPE